MTSDTIRLLNRLLAILCKSFPQYLQFSRPYVPAGHDDAMAVVAAVARDQQAMADRISRLIVEADECPRPGEFPMQFTDTHDLSIDWVLKEAVRCQAEDVEAIAAIVDRLQTAPAAKAAAEEALGMAKGHLESLAEVADGAHSAS
ncbi:MAG: hypothetical protein KDA61_21245 [Planctomycetales bacterium]|nr:hypothetical protein [Planctomycetales bacterium]